MTSIRFAVAAALFAAASLIASTAEACVSCNYTPEVVNTPTKTQKAKRAERPARETKKRVAKRPPAHQRPEPEIARKPPANEPDTEADTAAAPANEPATETVAKAPAAATEPAAAPVDTEPRSTSSSATTAFANRGVRTEEPAADAAVGCKRFSPTAGTTVPVPCD